MKQLFFLFFFTTSLFSFYLSNNLPKEAVQLVESFDCFSKDDKTVMYTYLLALKYRMEHVEDRDALVKSDLEYWRLWHLVSDIENSCELNYQFSHILEETLLPTSKEKKVLKKLRRVEGSIHTDGSSESSAKMSRYDEKLRAKLLLDPPQYKVLKKNPFLNDYDLRVLKSDPKQSISKEIYDELNKRDLKGVKGDLLFRYVLLQEERRRNYDKPKKRRNIEQELIYLAKCQEYHQNYLQIPYKGSFIRKLADRVSSSTNFYPALKREFLPKELENYCEHNITHTKVTTYIPKKEKSVKKQELKVVAKLKNLTLFLKQYENDPVKKKHANEYLSLMRSELQKRSTSTPSMESLKLLRLKNCLVAEDEKKDFALIMARVKDFRIEGIKETFYSNVFNSQRWWHLTIKMKMDAEGETPEMKNFFDCNQTSLKLQRTSSGMKQSVNVKKKMRFTEKQRRDAYWLNNEILKYYAVIFENKPTPHMDNKKAIKMGLVSKKRIDKDGKIKIYLGDKFLIRGMPNGGISLIYYGVPKGKLCTDFIQAHSLNSTIYFNKKTYDGLDYIMLNDQKIKLDHYVYKHVQKLCNKEDNNTISFVREETVVEHKYARKTLDSAFGRVEKIKSIDTHHYDPNSAAYIVGKENFSVIGNEAKLYNANLETLVQTLPSKLESSYNTALSADGKYLAVGRYGSTIHIWDMQKNKIVKTIKKNIGGVRMFLSDNKTLVVVDKQINLLDIESEEIVATIKPNYMPLKQKYNSTRISALAESPDGKMLYIGGNKNVIERWKIEKSIFGSGREVSYVDNIEDRTMGEIGALTFDKKDADILIIGSKNLKIKFWDTKNKKVQKTYIADEYMGCEDIVLSMDGKYMLAIGSHGAFLWKLDQEEQYDIIKGSKPVGGLFLEDSSKFILMARDISVWKIQEK
ncbi:MAG: hypothetical protein U9R13_00635 [Campylobacterota bacterium]|nr:hypothetical protein [Campylobacterota bacterium]